jgi:hypothetical protein
LHIYLYTVYIFPYIYTYTLLYAYILYIDVYIYRTREPGQENKTGWKGGTGFAEQDCMKELPGQGSQGLSGQD